MKSFTDLFIRRPVLALVVTLVILIAGFQAIRTLVVRQYPRSDNAAVTVTTVYVGASADLVRGFITTPLERAIAAADGIDYIESTSKLGLTTSAPKSDRANAPTASSTTSTPTHLRQRTGFVELGCGHGVMIRDRTSLGRQRVMA